MRPIVRFGATDAAALFFLFVIALSIRCMGIEERCLWSDEVVSIGYNSGDLLPDLARMTATDIHPPLYFLVQRLFLGLFPDGGTLALRGSALLASLAGVILAFLLGRDLFGLRAGIGAGLFLALSPTHILFAQTARMYSLTGLLLLAAIAAFRRLERGGPGSTRLLAAALTLGLYTYYPFVLPAATLAGVGFASLDGPRRRRLALAVGAALLALAPLLGYAAFVRVGEAPAYQKFLNTELANVPPRELVDTLARFTVETDVDPLRWLLLLTLLPLPLRLARDAGERRAARLVWALAVVPPLLLYAGSGLLVACGHSPVFVQRALFFTTGPLALWFGFLLSRFRRPVVFALLASALAVALLFKHQVVNVKYLDRGYRADAEFLAAHAGEASRIYFAPWFADDEFRHYRPERYEPVAFAAEEFGIRSSLDVFRNSDVSRGTMEALLAARLADDKSAWFFLKDLECNLGDGRMFAHDRFALDWFRRGFRLMRHHISAFPNGRGRHDLYLFSRRTGEAPLQKMLTVTFDTSRLPLTRLLAVNPVVEILNPGVALLRRETAPGPARLTRLGSAHFHYPRNELFYDDPPPDLLVAEDFALSGTFETLATRIAFDPADPFPAWPALSRGFARAAAFCARHDGGNPLELGSGPPLAGDDGRDLLHLEVRLDPSDDPLLRLAVFAFTAPALLAGLLGLAGLALRRPGTPRIDRAA